MSEKDPVVNQEIPAVVRALGTLALAAATAVAIKWFFSRDKNEEKHLGDDGTILQPHLEVKPPEDHCKNTGCNSRDTAITNEDLDPKVSDGLEDMVSDWSTEGPLKWHEGPLDKICISQRINAQEKDGQVAKDSDNISPGTGEQGDPTSISSGESIVTTCQDVCITNDVHVGKTELSALIGGVKLNDIWNQSLPSCQYDRNNELPCESLLSLGEHGNSWATGETSNIDEQMYDATGKSSGSKVQNTLTEHSNTLLGHRNLGLQDEKLARIPCEIADRYLTCFSTNKEFETEKGCMSGQSGCAWNGPNDTLETLSAQEEIENMLCESFENREINRITVNRNSIEAECSDLAVGEYRPNKDKQSENCEEQKNERSLTTMASMVIPNDLCLEAGDKQLENLECFQCSITNGPEVSVFYEDSMPSKRTECYREIVHLESHSTHKEYTAQNDIEKQQQTQLQTVFQMNIQSNNSEHVSMPLLRQNSLKPFTEWDNTRRIPQFIQMCSPFPVKVVGSATTVEKNVDRSLESRRDFLLNNKNVMHSSTEFSATTIYHIKYIDSLHEESSDCLHCDEHEGSTINDPSVVQRKRQQNEETHSSSLTYAKMLSTRTDCAVSNHENVVITNPNLENEFVSDHSEEEMVKGIREVSDVLAEINYDVIRAVGQTENKTLDQNLEVSRLIHPTETELLSTVQDVSLSSAETQSNANNREHQITGNIFHQETAYAFQDKIKDTLSPVEFTVTESSCQQSVLTKNLLVDGILKAQTTEKENTSVKCISEKSQIETNILSIYTTGTLSSQQNTLALKKITNQNKSTIPLLVIEKVDEKKTPSSNTLMTHFNLSKPQTVRDDQGQTGSTIVSSITHEEPQNPSLSFNELKKLYSKIPDTFSKNIPALSTNSNQKSQESNSTMSLVVKSCENIHHQFSNQKPKLKKKTQSTLCLLTQYYSSMPHSSENRLIEEVSRGSFVRIPRSLQEIGEAMRFQLTLGNCLELLKLARKNSVPELLKAVYTVISDNYLHVLKNSAIYGQLTGSDRERILQLRSRGKPSLCVVEIKSIFGWNKMGQSDEATGPCQIKAHIYALDMEKNQWNTTTCIPEEACLKGCSICTMHNYLFIAGGIRKTSEGSTCSSKLFCYNPLTDIWSQLTPMNQARSQHKLVPVDGHLYAIGGECLQTMEMYDPRYNKWTFKAPLPKGSFAVAHEATECGGEIYVSGGHLFYRLLKYSPAHDCWEECPYNGSKGRSCDMVATKNNLYRFDMQRDSTVSIFKYNTAAKVWTEYSANFPASKMPFRCAVLNNTIYCLNRETTAQFTDGDDEAIFEATVFSTFPSKGIGTPHPLVLNLPGSVSQTSV